MPYEKALWDGSDPLYAPHTSRSKRWYYWRVPAAARKLGYSHPPIRLPGEDGDGREAERAAKARQLTIDMLAAIQEQPAKLLSIVGTWRWLIGRYMTDTESPFQEVKANSRDSYRFPLMRWQEAIGDAQIDNMDLAELKRIQRTMRDNGRTVAYIKRQFGMLRMLVGYGIMLKSPACLELAGILKEMRIKTPKPRTAAPTRAQIEAIITAADSAGDAAFALGMELQWWFALRAVDVRGQWLRMGPEEKEKVAASGGITRGHFRWADGLTWDMIARDLTEFRKVPSKTEDSLDEELIFDLRLVPEVRERLASIPQEERIGPVIRDPKTDMPFDRYRWSGKFRAYRTVAGVPDDVWMMDTRAGAITDAKRAGASKVLMQHQANHSSDKTTNRYIREKSDSIARVIQLRRSAGGQQT